MNNKLIWVLQIVAAAILIPAGVSKFQGGPVDVMVFEQLDMEPFGRYLIGAIEVCAGLCMLTLHFSAIGSLFGLGVMIGAGIAHMTVLGFDPKHNTFLLIALSCCAIVFWARREHLPIIGRTLK